MKHSAFTLISTLLYASSCAAFDLKLRGTHITPGYYVISDSKIQSSAPWSETSQSLLFTKTPKSSPIPFDQTMDIQSPSSSDDDSSVTSLPTSPIKTERQDPVFQADDRPYTDEEDFLVRCAITRALQQADALRLINKKRKRNERGSIRYGGRHARFVSC